MTTAQDLHSISGWPYDLEGERYSSDLLLRKLPITIKHSITGEELTLGVTWHLTKEKWIADYSWSTQPHAQADTPNQALMELAAILFKENILSKETK